MTTANEQPWASGPKEILQHAIELLKTDSDTSRRLAMILTDNAVEQMIKTYLSLSRRITGIKIPRNKRQEAFKSFPDLLDMFEENASDKLDGIDLGLIEWYHRIRNQLYHEGIGMTVERQQPEVYADIANRLLNNLFGVTLSDQLGQEVGILGRFTEKWIQLESKLLDAANKHGFDSTRPRSLSDCVQTLFHANDLSISDVRLISRIRMLRNEALHSQTDYRTIITEQLISELEELIGRIA